MSKEKDRPTVGTDGLPLPILPPDRDVRVWAKLVRVMFYTPGFMALLLLKTGEPSGFGITVELLMLSSAAAVVAGLFIGAQVVGGGADVSSKVGLASCSLIMELLSAVPFLCAVPPLFHQLANSTLLHAHAPGAVDVSLGISELLPAVAVLPFMLYQLAGFGTLHYVVSKTVNWVLNLGILGLIVASYVANHMNNFGAERKLVGILVLAMAITVTYGVLKLRQMQEAYDERCPAKKEKDKDKKKEKENEVVEVVTRRLYYPATMGNAPTRISFNQRASLHAIPARLRGIVLFKLRATPCSELESTSSSTSSRSPGSFCGRIGSRLRGWRGSW